MYETLEHWKQYKQKKYPTMNELLENKITKVVCPCKEENLKEFDEWFAKLIAKNGTTNY